MSRNAIWRIGVAGPDAGIGLFEALPGVAEEDILQCNLLQVDTADFEALLSQRFDDLGK